MYRALMELGCSKAALCNSFICSSSIM
jgi:hypothetical protein